MDPVVVKAWLDIAGEALALLVLLVITIFAIIKFIDYIIKHPD